MIPEYLSPLGNHLWQSTLFAGAAGLLTLALRNNHARVRHWVWLAASCKFLIPLSVLVAVGGLVHWRAGPETVPSSLAVVVDEVSQPFTASAAASPWLVTGEPAGLPLPAVLLGIWACVFLGIGVAWCVRWRRIWAAVRGGALVRLELPIHAVSSRILLEPGVFGVFHPVLLLPEGIFERLTPAQLEAIISHELCQVRRRDNLIAAIHMFVETLFWFHPLVWWIGKRMVAEREQACDEEVLLLGSDPRVYAEGILNICKLYVESPLACVAGVTGSNLKRRIEAIMRNRAAIGLSFARKVALAGTVLVALGAPIVVGMMNASSTRAQSVPAAEPKFDVASIKPNNSPDGGKRGPIGGSVRFAAEGVVGRKATVRRIIQAAFGLTEYQVSGGPGWLDSDTFDVEAKTGSLADKDQLRQMLQSLLASRFKLTVHRGTKEMPVYFLTVGKNGPGPALHELKDGAAPPGPKNSEFLSHQAFGPTAIMRGTLEDFAIELSGPPFEFGRLVVDKTGLHGTYTGFLHWADENDDAISALRDELDLKLEPHKAPVDVLVIDHVEKPSEN